MDLRSIKLTGSPTNEGPDVFTPVPVPPSPPPPPDFTNSQIIKQINGPSPWYWSSNPITYAISVVPDKISGSEYLGLWPMTAHMIQMAELAFELWDDLIASELTRNDSSTDRVDPIDPGLVNGVK